MTLNTITSINGVPCNLVKAENAEALLSALVMAKNWMESEGPFVIELDNEIYSSVMEAINNAIRKATS